MTALQKSDKPLIGCKFPKWIFHIILGIPIIILKGGTKGYRSEKEGNESTRMYNQGH